MYSGHGHTQQHVSKSKQHRSGLRISLRRNRVIKEHIRRLPAPHISITVKWCLFLSIGNCPCSQAEADTRRGNTAEGYMLTCLGGQKEGG